MASRVGDRDGAPLRDPEQREPYQFQGVHHGFEVPDPRVERELFDRPVGESAAPLVVAHQRVVAGELPDPVPPDRAVAVKLEMAEPVGGLDQGWPAPGGRVGDAHAVAGGAEADLLIEGRAHGVGSG